MLTRDRRDGLWYPDPTVGDGDAAEHAILKWAGDATEEARLVLAAEAPYLELARAFGLRCGAPLTHRGAGLMMPRFDRRIENGAVIRIGQESLVSAAGVAAFGHQARHERLHPGAEGRLRRSGDRGDGVRPAGRLEPGARQSRQPRTQHRTREEYRRQRPPDAAVRLHAHAPRAVGHPSEHDVGLHARTHGREPRSRPGIGRSSARWRRQA